MVIGYNERRPRKSDYTSFLRNFVRDLDALDDEAVSFMIYGSYARGDFIPGRSDIDAVLIFPDDVVIDKRKMHQISRSLYERLRQQYVPFQITPLDTLTLTDGRFHPFNETYEESFEKEGKVLAGRDYRKTMTCPDHKTGSEATFSNGLRRVREHLLFAEYDRRKHYEQFLEHFHVILDTVTSGSRQMIYLVQDELVPQPFAALNELPNIFPDLDLEPLRRIQCLYTTPQKLDRMYEHPDRVIEIEQQAVTFFESMIREYIQRFPREDNED